MRRTVLLDLDGTLVDSAAAIVEHLAAALTAVGAPVPGPERLRLCVGPPFETALPALGLTDDQASAATRIYRRSYDAVAATVSPLYPGTAALLARLRADGYRLAVATSKPESLAREIVAQQGIGEGVELVGGADHVAGRVGKAAVVGSVLERLGLDAAVDPVVMVGDRVHDVEGAALHGVPAIGVTWGYALRGEFTGARRVVDTADELVTVLRCDGLWSVSVGPAR
ncbi:MAG: HAD hydrolase-like protein [Pseudonocardia sp.]